MCGPSLQMLQGKGLLTYGTHRMARRLTAQVKLFFAQATNESCILTFHGAVAASPISQAEVNQVTKHGIRRNTSPSIRNV
jgi:hypothetical protein